MISTHELNFSYDERHQFRFPDLELEDENNLVIVGESGVGKTTLLHLLAGILKPASGNILINDLDITKLSGRHLDIFRGRNIGLIFQKSYFISSLNLLENLLLVQFLADKSQNRERINELTERLGIIDSLHKNPYKLSHGQQQRASIAMALVNGPVLVLADEPTSSLDDKHCNEVIALLREQSAISQSSLVIITHDQRVKAHFKNVMTL